MAAYYVTALGGLEGIVRREIAERLVGATVEVSAPAGERGRTFFTYGDPPADVLSLRSVEDVFAAVGQFDGLPADETGLEAIRAWAAASDLTEAAAVHAQVHGPRETPSFRCTSKRFGEHAFGSMDIMAAAGAGVVDRYGWRVDLEGHDYDIHVDVEDGRCTIGLRITPVSLRRRGRIVHVAASLNPTLGYAMCVLSDPQPGEVFVDPTCGAGTVLLERAEIGPARLVAGDLFAHPLEMARRNVVANAVEAHLLRWDARRLPLAAESVDKVCANLPWGRRAGSHLVNKHLYPPLIREIARVLKVGGRAVLLSLEKRMLLACVDRHGWLRTTDILPVSVAGLKPAVYVIEKWRGQEGPPEDDREAGGWSGVRLVERPANQGTDGLEVPEVGCEDLVLRGRFRRDHAIC